MQKKPVPEKFIGVSLRLAPVVVKQLAELKKLWGENTSHAIRRCISTVYEQIKKNT